MADSTGSKIIVGVASAIGTAAVLWGVAQTGGLIKQVFIPDLPGGAVVAFDGKCPESDGWVPYKAAEGRFLLGVGQGPLAEPVHAEQPGGNETHALTVEEMPTHSHAAGDLRATQSEKFLHASKSSEAVDGGARTDGIFKAPPHTQDYGNHLHEIAGHTATQGDGTPHNNMPPFVALYFCKKEG